MLRLSPVAVLGGLVNRASYFGYGFGCFYARLPHGSACADVQAVAGFLKGFAATAAFIYAIWAFVFLIVFLFRRRKKADAGGF
jgi:hypothetical protein